MCSEFEIVISCVTANNDEVLLNNCHSHSVRFRTDSVIHQLTHDSLKIYFDRNTSDICIHLYNDFIIFRNILAISSQLYAAAQNICEASENFPCTLARTSVSTTPLALAPADDIAAAIPSFADRVP